MSAPEVPPSAVFHEAQERMAFLPNYYAWICSHFADQMSGTVLELGSGAGFVVRNYADRVERVVAVDLEQELLDRLAASYPKGKIRTARVDLAGDWRELEGVRADAVVALDVLEHFEDDAAFVGKIARHLKPGGKAVLKVPAQSRLYGEIDRVSGHWRRYDVEGLERLMTSRGFRTRRLRHMNAAGAWGYRMKRHRRESYSETFSPGKLKLVNALIPMLALIDRVPGLKGLSLIGVFERVE
ncbi:MAG TPA: class I SAM-dependent methyltransferase [Planctomycetota bacterium]|jgi:cyclopropane fatty-acyl-phospholipid synthase-like methyltransferase|nr:class I SAM-dependent methyltransferase [Planctomycetota bacterium]